MADAPAPGEIGVVLPSWSTLGGGYDEVAALAWPNGINIFHKMRADSQIDALIKATSLPVLRMHWAIDPNGARDEVVQVIAEDLGLPIVGAEDELRGRRRFNHQEHLRHALLALWYGHMFMEIVGIVDDDLTWRLRKLAPRMPQTISKIHVAKDGGLEGITQHGYRPPQTRRALLMNAAPQIPVDRLVAYSWDREGGNWAGRSMLRPLYRDWLLKDRALRVDAIKNERFGAGIPTGKAPPGGDPTEYQRMAAAIRASETGGAGLPDGASIGVEGVRGSLPDVMASIRYYDESMARSFLAMFMQLGQTQTGSRALGETFTDFFEMATESVANWYATITNEHVIEDIVDWNWGPDENAPLLTWARPERDSLAIDELVRLIDAGILVVDDAVNAWVRQRYDLPQPDPASAVAPEGIPEDAGDDAVPFSLASGTRPAKGQSSGVQAHLPGEHNQKDHGNRGGPAFVFGTNEEIAEARAIATAKIENAPVPSAAAVAKARAELLRAKQGKGRAGGDSRGGNATDRRRQRYNLFKEFGGEERGYVVDYENGLKLHWTDDPELNPEGYPVFERGKIFTKAQGGGYQLPNLLPESFATNRSRNNTPIRPENLDDWDRAA